ncbi:MAG: hypothetical protein Q9203_007600, partial [Teloschistes exilis]
VRDLGDMEGTLSDIDLQICIDKFLEDSLNMDLMFSFVITIDQDIIEVGRDELIQPFLEGVIDMILEGGRAIAKAERHNKVLEKAKTGTECCQCQDRLEHK